MAYITPGGVIVDDNDWMPGDVPYNPSTPARPSSTRETTKPMDRWAGRKSTSPGHLAAMKRKKNVNTGGIPVSAADMNALLTKPTDQAGAQAAVAGATSDLTSSIPRARGMDWLKSEADRLRSYGARMAPQRTSSGWSWKI